MFTFIFIFVIFFIIEDRGETRFDIYIYIFRRFYVFVIVTEGGGGKGYFISRVIRERVERGVDGWVGEGRAKRAECMIFYFRRSSGRS